MSRKGKRRVRPAPKAKSVGRQRKRIAVGLVLAGVIVAAIVGLRYYLQAGQKNEQSLYARGPANAAVVLREFSSFT